MFFFFFRNVLVDERVSSRISLKMKPKMWHMLVNTSKNIRMTTLQPLQYWSFQTSQRLSLLIKISLVAINIQSPKNGNYSSEYTKNANSTGQSKRNTYNRLLVLICSHRKSRSRILINRFRKMSKSVSSSKTRSQSLRKHSVTNVLRMV